MKYLALFRGVNVGGKNKLSMAELKLCLADLGLKNVETYINSGNALFESSELGEKIAKTIEATLVKKFKFDSDIIKVLVASKPQFAAIIADAPKGFGQEPDTYHSDVAFLIDIDAKEAFETFELNPEVDAMWPGKGVVYYRRLSAKRTKSRLSRVISKPVYKSMTIRSWNTTVKLFTLLSRDDSPS
jgi:uncharacterized protein (DUF1697 family)